MNLSEHNYCKPLLSFIIKNNKHHRNSKYCFTLLSLVSSPNSSLETTRERTLYLSSLLLTPLFLSSSSFFAQEGNPSFWIPRGKAQTLSRQITLNTVRGRRQGVVKPNALSHDGEPKMVRSAGVSLQLYISMYFDTAQLVVEVHLLLMEREAEFRPAGWIPDQADFPLIPVFLQQSDCWHQEHQRRCSRAALFCWLEKVPSTERLTWPFQVKPLHYLLWVTVHVTLAIRVQQILWEDGTVHDLWAIQGLLQPQRVDGNSADILLHHLACNSLPEYNFPIGKE